MLVIKQQRIQEEKCTSLLSRRLLPSREDKALQRRSKSKLITETQTLASVKSRVVSCIAEVGNRHLWGRTESDMTEVT